MIKVGNHFNPEKSPDDLDVLTFEEVHTANNTNGGAYLADVIASSHYQSDILLGTSKHHILKRNNYSEKCKACLMNITRKKIHMVNENFDDDEEEKEQEGGGWKINFIA